MRALETTADADEAQLAVYRRMSLDQRLVLAIRIADDGFQLARDGIQLRHPEYDQRQVFLAFVRMLHGDEVFAKVWPGQPALTP